MFKIKKIIRKRKRIFDNNVKMFINLTRKFCVHKITGMELEIFSYFKTKNRYYSLFVLLCRYKSHQIWNFTFLICFSMKRISFLYFFKFILCAELKTDWSKYFPSHFCFIKNLDLLLKVTFKIKIPLTLVFNSFKFLQFKNSKYNFRYSLI